MSFSTVNQSSQADVPALRPPTSSPFVPPPASSSMKDLSSSSRSSRYNALAAKKPSSHGIQKRKYASPATAGPAHGHSPRARMEAAIRRQRELQLIAWKREGIYLEEEYYDEIHLFLHEMEVRIIYGLFDFATTLAHVRRSVRPWARPRQWTNNRRSNGICGPASSTFSSSCTSRSA